LLFCTFPKIFIPVFCDYVLFNKKTHLE
jgi:hypothetical protein